MEPRVTVAAVMLVRDEADIIRATVEHLLDEVDWIYVADNRSSDGTTEILREFEAQGCLAYTADEEVGYWQAKKTTALAREAYADGHEWVVPVDADELWNAERGYSLSRYLSGLALDVQVVCANIFNHVPTGADELGHPFEKIGWRQPRAQSLGKVAARAHPALRIHAGNHWVDYTGLPFFDIEGLTIRHFPWRSEAQYLRKIRNGEEAYAATDLPEGTGAHWRMWAGQPDEAILAHYREWFYEPEPPGRHGLVYDPAFA